VRVVCGICKSIFHGTVTEGKPISLLNLGEGAEGWLRPEHYPSSVTYVPGLAAIRRAGKTVSRSFCRTKRVSGPTFSKHNIEASRQASMEEYHPNQQEVAIGPRV